MAYSDINYITTKGVLGSQELADLADTDPTHANGDIGDAAVIAAINGAIAAADELVDSFLRVVYEGTLPVASPPELLKRASAEIAIYFLWQQKHRTDSENPMEKRHDYWAHPTRGYFANLTKERVALLLGGGTVTPSYKTDASHTIDDREFIKHPDRNTLGNF